MLPAPSTLSLHIVNIVLFIWVGKFAFLCSRAVWSFGSCPCFCYPRALIDSFTLSGASAAHAPAPLALCCSVVSVWFQLGAFPQDPQSVLGAHAFLLCRICRDSPFYVPLKTLKIIPAAFCLPPWYLSQV